MSKIIVPILPTARQMERLLQSLINDKESNFSNALDRDVSHINQRAHVDAVRVTDVDITGSLIEVTYDVEYSIYNGCKDMNVQDAEELHVFGELTSEGWEFEEHVPPPKRTTMDEF